MICSECGKETPDDSLFCENCGHAVTRAKNPNNALSAAGTTPAADDDILDAHMMPAITGGSTTLVTDDGILDRATPSRNNAEPSKAEAGPEPAANAVDSMLAPVGEGDAPDDESDVQPLAAALEQSAPNDSELYTAGDGPANLGLLADDDSEFAPIDLYSRLKNLDVSTMARPANNDEFIYPATVPLQPRLGKARTIAIAIVGALFGAALILLFCIAVMRLLGI